MRSLLAMAAAALLALPAAAETVTVFAAASLKTALDEIAAGYSARMGDDVTVSFAGSSALARQIQAGAPADVFISANTDWMDRLEAEGRIAAGTRSDLLGNSIVLIAHGEVPATDDIAAALAQGRIAMALVEAVPAGIYGKAALTHMGLWDRVQTRVIQADNVRAALAFVALGEAPRGIVYATDAAVEPRVSVLATFPPDSHPPIVYPAALTADAGPEAAAFLDYLKGPEARAVFDRLGFSGPGD
ncbi:molybdate ABC transporter substrate-binding protein [Marinibacterium profundimaris]|uniref:Molybdenum ABC transporter substrate-binding protein n=1 Tax=Marinibacterium profundimaris TaxID=1679460 RepID=A0A225NLL8_9RHOB|nr:molybdate ABC transporter substrate-binding protein [Marinibacterium profundimaris]OWU72931.1 molybdenum ABC transporter substrate-binding protein [Marinibacterium profundimaris]